jgi:hypothetical protein
MSFNIFTKSFPTPVEKTKPAKDDDVPVDDATERNPKPSNDDPLRSQQSRQA